MRAYINKLQSKPEEVRKQILVASLVVSMVFVGAVWVYGLTDRFNDEPENVAIEEETENISPFKVFTNSLGSAYSNIGANVSNFSFDGKSDTDTSTNQEKQIDMIPVERNYVE